MSVSRRVWWGAGLVAVALLGWGGWTVWNASRVLDEQEALATQSDSLKIQRRTIQPVAGEVWVAADDFLDAAVWEGDIWAISSAAVIAFDGEGREIKRLRVGLELPAAPLTALAVASVGGNDRPSLFIGTLGGGLLRYDGRVVEQMQPEDAKRSKVRALLALPAGRLAVGTERGALVFDGTALTLLHEQVGQVAVSALAGEDRVWVGTSSQGLWLVSGGTAQRVNGLPEVQVLSLAAQEDRVWAALAAGVAQVRGTSMERMALPGVTALSLGVQEGQLRVGGVEGGLKKMSWSDGPGRVVDEAAIGGMTVHAIHTLGASALAQTLVAGKGGLWLQAAGTWTRFAASRVGTLASAHVSAITGDQQGRWWVGYFDEGLQVFSSSRQSVLRVNDDRIYCVNALWQAAGESRMWVGTANGLAEFEGNLQMARWLTKQDGLMSSHVTSLSGNPERWLAGTPAGLSLRGSDGFSGLSVLQGLPNNHVYAVGWRDGQALVGTLGGLALLDGGRVSRTWTTANSVLKANWITAVVPWKDGWMVGTYGGGVYRLRGDGQLSREEEVPRDLVVNPLAMAASQDHVWAGSLDRGLFRYDVADDRWTAIYRGLPSLNVTAIYVSGGTLYAGTDNGVGIIRE